MSGNFCGTLITLEQHLTQEGKKNLCIILTALHAVGMNVCPVHRLVSYGQFYSMFTSLIPADSCGVASSYNPRGCANDVMKPI